jgi:hypothetical protein
MTNDKFKAALGEEAYGVFGRTGLTPSQLADGLAECQHIREEWCNGYTKMRDALRDLVDALSENDEDGLTEFAPQMAAARAVLGS